MAWNVVIVGGGFAGMSAARELERIMPKQSARLILVNDVNFMLYTPFLPEAAAGTLEPRHVVTPLRDILKRTDLRLGAVNGHDPAARTVELRDHGGDTETLRYDQLVVAVGSVSRSLPIPGLEQHAIGFKSLADAIWLRNHVIETLEQANATEDPARREELLTYVFVGGGYSGLEALAELQDFAADAMDHYPRARLHGMRWILVEAAGPGAARRCRSTSRSTRCASSEAAASTSVSGPGSSRRPPTDTLLSTGERVPTPDPGLDRGREAAPVAGDAVAAARRRRPGQGRRADAGRGAERRLGDRRLRRGAASPAAAVARARRPRRWPCARGRRSPTTSPPSSASTPGRGGFGYKGREAFVNLGRYKAVGKIGRLKFRGFLAWWMARTYHMSQIPGSRAQGPRGGRLDRRAAVRRDTAEVGSIGHPRPLSAEVYARGGTHRPLD